MTARHPGAGWTGDSPGQGGPRERKRRSSSKLEMVAKLQAGEAIENHREGGNSMTPLIKSRQPCNIVPVGDHELERGDIVFVKVHGNFYMHKIVALDKHRVQIGNNHGRINGWTPRSNVYGLVEPQ